MIKAPHLKVLLIDKGFDIYNRRCPINLGLIDKCPVDKEGHAGCSPACSITMVLAALVPTLMVSLILRVIWRLMTTT